MKTTLREMLRLADDLGLSYARVERDDAPYDEIWFICEGPNGDAVLTINANVMMTVSRRGMRTFYHSQKKGSWVPETGEHPELAELGVSLDETDWHFDEDFIERLKNMQPIIQKILEVGNA